MGKQWKASSILNPLVSSQLCNLNGRQHLTVCHSLLFKIFLHTLSSFSPNFLTTPSRPPLLALQHLSELWKSKCPTAQALKLFFYLHSLDDLIPSYDLETIYVLLAPKLISPAQISPLNYRLISATAYFMSLLGAVLYLSSLICSKWNPWHLFAPHQTFFCSLLKHCR